MKVLSAILLSLSLVLPISAAQPDDPEALLYEGQYFDVPAGAWYAKAAAWCRLSGCLSGTSKSTFSPEEPITRLQFLAALHHLEGSEQVVEGSRFSDVSAARRELSAVLWAFESGVTTGISPTRFAPDSPISRQDAALLLYRCAGLPDAGAGDAPVFSDRDETAPWAAEAVAWAAGAGLLNGLGEGRLAPAEELTRAQAAVLLWRYDQYKAISPP